MADDYEIRVDGETGQSVIDLPHGQFGLGCKPSRVSAHFGSYPPVGATYPDIPESQWTEQDFRPWCIPVQNQGQTSACGPFSLKEVMGLAFNLAFGQAGDKPPDLSAWFAYGVLERGRDDGTALPDLLMVAEKYGLPPNSAVKVGDFSGNYPQAVHDAAKSWKIEAAYNAMTFANVCSCLERRQPVLIGVDIGVNFNPDRNGVLPDYRQGPQMLGHALSVAGKKKINGRWYLISQNHWTPGWGEAGFAYMPESYINPQFGGWALRVPTLNPGNPNAPPAF